MVPAPQAPPALPPRPPDPWLGTDKLRHFVMSGLTVGVAHAAATTVGIRRRPALGLAVGVAGAIGIGKELYDRGHRGRPSVRDLVWDAAGIATWSALVARSGR